MRRIAIALMIGMAAVSLGACAAAQNNSSEAAAAETEAEAEPAAEPAAEQEAEPAAPETPSGESETKAAAVLPSVAFDRYSSAEFENGEMISRCVFETFRLTEEAAAAYPSLDKALADNIFATKENYDQYFDEVEEASKQYLQEYGTGTDTFPAGEIEAHLDVVRCDTDVLSLRETCYSYNSGAAHGMTGYEGHNYNAATGEKILLTDVIADTTALLPAVAENLTAVADGIPVTDVEDALRFAFEDGFDNLDWVLEQDGITFMFAPSDIAAYAAGPLEAKISFARYPSLFTGNYGAGTGSFVRSVSTYGQLSVDLDGDGTRESVSVTGVSDENSDLGAMKAIRVAVDGEAVEAEEYCYTLTSYLVHTDEGANYIYAMTTTDNEYPKLSVFALNGKMPVKVGEMDGSGIAGTYVEVYEDDGEVDADGSYIEEYPIVDPSSFRLSTRTNLMSTYSAQRAYKTGGNGMPEPLTEYYDINVSFALTSRVPLTLEVVDVNSGELTGGTREVPAGTSFRFLRTNRVDTVDFILDDGTVVRVKVDAEGSQTINGAELEEVFDGTIFAG